MVALFLLGGACDKEPETKNIQVEFRMSVDDSALGESEYLSYMYISITNENGAVLYANKKVSFVAKESGYVSDLFELPEGNYIITSIMYMDSNDKLIMLAPKESGSMSSLSSVKVPLDLAVSNSIPDEVEVPAVSLKKHNVTPAQLGYTGVFSQYGQSQTSRDNVYPELCIQIGVDDQEILTDPIPFQITSEDEILLEGECSMGVSDFAILELNNYILQTILPNGSIASDTFSLVEIRDYTCETDDFINLLDYNQPIPDTADTIIPQPELIAYLKQVHVSGTGTSFVTYINMEGQIFEGESQYYISNIYNLETVTGDYFVYDSILSTVNAFVGEVDKDTLSFYYMNYYPEGGFNFNPVGFDVDGEHEQIYAIYRGDFGDFAVLMDSENMPVWGNVWITPVYYDVLHWLHNIDFYYDGKFATHSY